MGPVLVGVALVSCGVGTAPRQAAQSTGSTPTPTARPTASAPRLPRLTSTGAGVGVLSRAAGRVPTTVALGRLHLSGTISPVDVGPDGTLGVPHDAVTVGWWQHGALPGDPGVALLAAHVDYSRVPGIFFRLAQVRVGDRVVVGAADGSTSAWRVVRRVQTPKQQLPVADLSRPDGPATLVLVTCGGSFDAAKHSYRDNVLVYATRVR